MAAEKTNRKRGNDGRKGGAIESIVSRDYFILQNRAFPFPYLKNMCICVCMPVRGQLERGRSLPPSTMWFLEIKLRFLSLVAAPISTEPLPSDI